MKIFMPLVLALISVDLLDNQAFCGEVTIVDARVTCSTDCRFSVTLQHDDEGWDHYANQWDVMTLDGKLLKSRVLLHPHVEEQPFTRSLSGVGIPEGTKVVKIRAKDLKHGYSKQEFIVELSGD